MLRPVPFVCLAALIFTGSLTSLFAQSLPALKSETLIDGELLFPDGDTAQFSIEEGTVLTVRSKTEGYWYGIAPQVFNLEEGVLYFTLFEIRKGDKISIEQLGPPVELINGEPLVIETGEGFIQIFLRSVAPKNSFKNKSMSPRGVQKFGATGGLCCVSCGGLTVCGGSVTMSCDSCTGRPAI